VRYGLVRSDNQQICFIAVFLWQFYCSCLQ